MNWEDLHTAAAVARHRGYPGAASELGVDPTTVSRRIARLEQALGVRLFDAAEGERKPTREGARALERLSAMEREAQEIGKLGSPAEEVSGLVRLSCTASIAEQILAPHLAAFLAENPALRLEMRVGDANANLQRWESDLALRLARPERGGFVARRVAALPLWFIRPRSAAGDGLVCAYPEELERAPEMKALAAEGLLEGARLVTSQVSVIRHMLESGGASGVLPETAARRLLARPDLDCRLLSERREVWLLTQARLRGAPAIKAVSAWIDLCFALSELK